MVHSVKEVTPKVEVKPDDIVLKYSWYSVYREGEDVILLPLLQKRPELKDYLSGLYFHRKYDAEKDHLDLPRFRMERFKNWQKSDAGKGFERRDHVVTVSSKLTALWHARTIEEFKDIFVDCLECHHRASEKGVLHRDVSINNLMFRQKDNKATGVMNDWDLFTLVDGNKKVEKSKAKFRIDILPFLAMALLVEEKEGKPTILPYRAYHHDLESFFYILVWAGLHFHLNGMKIKGVHPQVMEWTGRMKNARDAKKGLLSGTFEWDSLCAEFTQECKALAEWIHPVWLMFSHTFTQAHIKQLEAASTGSTLAQKQAAYEKYVAENLTFEKFMKALGRKPREWSDLKKSEGQE